MTPEKTEIEAGCANGISSQAHPRTAIGPARVVPRPAGRTKPFATVLVVDDAPANLQVLAGMLKDRGHKVRPAPSGKLALLAARKDPPDPILRDINTLPRGTVTVELTRHDHPEMRAFRC